MLPLRPFYCCLLCSNRHSSNLSISATHSKQHPATDWRGTFYIPTRLLRGFSLGHPSLKEAGWVMGNLRNDPGCQLFSAAFWPRIRRCWACQKSEYCTEYTNARWHGDPWAPGGSPIPLCSTLAPGPSFRGCTSGRAYRDGEIDTGCLTVSPVLKNKRERRLLNHRRRETDPDTWPGLMPIAQQQRGVSPFPDKLNRDL